MRTSEASGCGPEAVLPAGRGVHAPSHRKRPARWSAEPVTADRAANRHKPYNWTGEVPRFGPVSRTRACRTHSLDRCRPIGRHSVRTRDNNPALA